MYTQVHEENSDILICFCCSLTNSEYVKSRFYYFKYIAFRVVKEIVTLGLSVITAIFRCLCSED